MYEVTILAADTLVTMGKGRGASWEEAAFDGYDRAMREKGESRRYLAQVEEGSTESRKKLRFGFRSEQDLMMSDPAVIVCVEEL
jgi:hypothetical protein